MTGREDMIEITDLEKPELAIYRERSEIQLLRMNEPAPGIFMGESAKVIRRALDAGYEPDEEDRKHLKEVLGENAAAQTEMETEQESTLEG